MDTYTETVPPKRRRRALEGKRRIVEETLAEGASVALPSSRSAIHIQLQHAQVSIEGSADEVMLRVVLECLQHDRAARQHRFGLRTLQADTYAGFNPLYETGRIQEAACWAHVRRKFYDLQEAQDSLVASEALERIAALYGIEKEIRGRPAEERQQIRDARAKPLLESLPQWLRRHCPSCCVMKHLSSRDEEHAVPDGCAGEAIARGSGFVFCAGRVVQEWNSVEEFKRENKPFKVEIVKAGSPRCEELMRCFRGEKGVKP